MVKYRLYSGGISMMLSLLKLFFSKDPAVEFGQKADLEPTPETKEEIAAEKSSKYSHPWSQIT